MAKIDNVHFYTSTDSRLSYLDLEINIRDRKFTTAVFNKQDGSSFHIDNFPHMHG